MTNIFQFSGNSNVTLRTTSNINFNGTAYEKDEPILTLKNVLINFSYSEKQKKAISSVGNLISYQYPIPETLQITDAKVTDETLGLMGIKQEGNKGFIPHTQEGFSDANGNFYVKDIIANKPYFVYDINKNKANAAAVDNKFTGLNPDSAYTVNYYSEKDRTSGFAIGKKMIPHLKIEIETVGNINSKTGKMFITIPKAVPNNTPIINPTYNLTVSNILNFTIIFDGKPNSFPTVEFF